MTPLPIAQAFQTAVQHHQAGRLQQAEPLYRQILAQQPNNPDALHLLGVIATQVGRHDAAVDLMRRAIAVRPQFPEALNNLAAALKETGQSDEAIAACRQAIALKADFPDAYNNLGNALAEKKQFEEAIAAYRQAIALRPNHCEAFSNLGNALRQTGHLQDAIAACRQSLTINPHYALAHHNLGALRDNGNADEAIECYRNAISLQPGLAQSHNNLGTTLFEKGRLDEAILALLQATKLKPDHVEALNNLGTACRHRGLLDEAVAALERVLTIHPDNPEALSNLANVLKDSGRIDQAIALYRQALPLAATDSLAKTIRSNLCYALHFHADADPATILNEHRLWNQHHAQPLQHLIRPHANTRDPDRRLRIGYLSPDFRQHPVGRFLVPLFANHDHQHFEIFAYAHVTREDARTHQLRDCTDTWRNIVGLSDDQAAQLIRDDQIDILVDLTMHMANNRILVFARKPAPIQVTYLAYCSTTGLAAMDYRLTDVYLDPPGTDETVYTEQTIRLPKTYWCYEPLPNVPDPNALPALSNNSHITFGCLNNFAKVTDPTLDAWLQILHALPNSHILIYSRQGSHRNRVSAALAGANLSPERIEFTANSGDTYFPTYHRIDIALDPFPCGGGTTTCDALWMGVPVVSLSGETAVGRSGLSILSNIGLADLVATTPAQYIDLATTLAADIPRLVDLRATLRHRMQASPLMDAQSFAQDIEFTYRDMWRRYCQPNTQPSS